MTNEQIKQELIKMGWKDKGIFIKRKIRDNSSVLYFFNNVPSLHLTLERDSIWIHNPTLPQIKALIYGLTGEEV